MKRLVRKSSYLDTLQNEDNSIDTGTMDSMVGMGELDEAAIRHDKCAICHNYPLRRTDGFKKCHKCHTIYKILDGDSYVVVQDENDAQ